MKILIVTVRPPWPPRDGGLARTYNLARELGRHAEVTVLALNLGALPAEQPSHLSGAIEAYEVLNLPRSRTAKLPILARTYLTSRTPFAPMQFAARDFTELIRSRVAGAPFDILQIEGVIAAGVVPMELFGADRAPRIVLDAMDVEADRLLRQSRVQRNAVAHLFYRCEARRMSVWERDIARRCSGILTVSDNDAAAFRAMAPSTPVTVAHNGADLEHYRPLETPRQPDMMLYVGSMEYPPNLDAARWFCAEILPLIRQRAPQARLRFVGKGGEKLGEWGSAPGNEVCGLVPDVLPYYAQCGVCIVPLRSGGGTRLKIIEALACGCPVVSTSLGAEGLPVVSGEHLLIADAPQAFAEAVQTLFADPAAARELGARGCQLIREQLGWEAIGAGVAQFYEQIIASE